MKSPQLQASKRTISGHKVKTLRDKGVIPATVYGKTTKPVSVEIAHDQFTEVYRKTGETGLIELLVEDENRPVLIKNVQLDPVSMKPIHVEFQQVNLKEKIKAHVPVLITGESLAVKEKTGTLLQLLNEVEVEALPADLPEHILVDISGLVNVNDHITAKNLAVSNKVQLLTDPEIMVVKIGELLAPEPEPEPVAVPPEGEAVEGSPGETATGEQGSEEKKEAPAKSEEPSKKA